MEIASLMKLGIGVAMAFIIFGTVIVPQWNTTAGTNVTGTGLSASAFQGFMLLIGLSTIGAIIYKIVGSGKGG
jgi:hypothetical protein